MQLKCQYQCWLLFPTPNEHGHWGSWLNDWVDTEFLEFGQWKKSPSINGGHLSRLFLLQFFCSNINMITSSGLATFFAVLRPFSPSKKLKACKHSFFHLSLKLFPWPYQGCHKFVERALNPSDVKGRFQLFFKQTNLAKALACLLAFLQDVSYPTPITKMKSFLIMWTRIWRFWIWHVGDDLLKGKCAKPDLVWTEEES